MKRLVAARWAVPILILVATSFALHFFRLGWPASPVFDEAYFATYSADYVKGVSFIDIHPPLGKIIYAGALAVSWKASLDAAEFVRTVHEGGALATIVRPTLEFGDFPYWRLRAVSAAFGILLAVAFYFFMMNLGCGKVGSFFGALCIVFDNALLLQTRLILLDGMYLAFGIAALAIYFKYPNRIWLVGILLGLSLGVKMIGIVFLGPILASALLAWAFDDDRKALLGAVKIFAIALCVLAGIFSANFLFITPQTTLAAIAVFGFSLPMSGSALIMYLRAMLAMQLFSFVGYLQGGAQFSESPWYLWPAMQVPIAYYSEMVAGNVRSVVSSGNPVVWYGGTFAVAKAAAHLLGKLKGKIRRADAFGRRSALLLMSYIFALLPFFTVVKRSTFLYHYFPALMFAIALLADLVASSLFPNRFALFGKKDWRTLVGCVAVLIVGFFSAVSGMYGF